MSDGNGNDGSIDNNRERGDVLSDAHRYIQKELEQDYSMRMRGYLSTQSLKKISDVVDDSSIVHIEGRRSASEGQSTVNEVPYFNIRMNREVDSRLNWDVQTRDESLDTQRLIDIVDSYGFGDVCVTNLAVQFWDDELFDRLESMLWSIGGHSIDLSEFEQPFVMELSSSAVNEEVEPVVYETIREHHKPKYWSPSGLNWDIRSMNVESLHTRTAYDTPDAMAGLYNGVPITLRVLEDYAFNRAASNAAEYGFIDSRVFSQHVEEFFGGGNVGVRQWDWTTSGGWEPTDVMV